MEEQTEFNQLPTRELIAVIEQKMQQINPVDPSQDAIVEIRELLDGAMSRLGNLQGDEEDIDSADEGKLSQLSERLDSLAPTSQE